MLNRVHIIQDLLLGFLPASLVCPQHVAVKLPCGRSQHWTLCQKLSLRGSWWQEYTGAALPEGLLWDTLGSGGWFHCLHLELAGNCSV